MQETWQHHSRLPISANQCNEKLAQFTSPLPQAEMPLDLNRGFYSAFGSTQFTPRPDQIARQQAAAHRAGLTQVIELEIAALSPARVVQTHTGSGVSAGAVSTGVNVFAFVAAQGDQVSLEISVTDVLPGRLYSDEDSQIFLFDSEGTLLAENDDLSRLQSQIIDFSLPATGLYYLAVTTYNNDPILDSAQRITDWNGNGGSAIEYTLTVTGLTPAGQLALPEASQP